MSDQTMLQEAINAAQVGEKARARDLLTRLLRKNQSNPEYWYWMSAVVETQREQIFCLENLLKLKPGDKFARRGLIMLGALPPDDSLVPPPASRAQMWKVEIPKETKTPKLNPKMVLTFAGFLGTLAIFVGLILFGIFGINALNPPAQPLATPNFLLTATFIQYATLTPSAAPTQPESPMGQAAAPVIPEQTPFSSLLRATYTPTPMFVATPHPETEYYRFALLERQRGDLEKTIQNLVQAIEALPNAADLHFQLGDTYMQLGEYQKALYAFQTAVNIDRSFGPAYYGIAIAKAALDPKADTSQELAEAEKLSPDFSLIYIENARAALRNNQIESARDAVVKAKTLLPESAIVFAIEAEIFLEGGEYSEALRTGQEALSRDVTLIPVYLVVAKAYLGDGNLSKGVEFLEKYIWYTDFSVDGLRLLGSTYLDAGEFQKAVDIFGLIVETDNLDSDAFYQRGQAYLKLNNGDAALEDFQSANRLRRGRFDYNLGIAQGLFATGAVQLALLQLNETLPLATNDLQKAELYYNRAVLLASIRQFAGARADANRILQLEDVLPVTLVEQAQQLLESVETALSTLTPAAPQPTQPGTPANPTPTPGPSATPAR